MSSITTSTWEERTVVAESRRVARSEVRCIATDGLGCLVFGSGGLMGCEVERGGGVIDMELESLPLDIIASYGNVAITALCRT